MTESKRCRIGWHDFVDFPDPNPESGGLEKQGYRACTRCSKERDRPVYLWLSNDWSLPGNRRRDG